LFLQRHVDPVDFRLDERVRVVGTHRTAEDDGACVAGHRVGEGIAESGPADIQRKALVDQHLADATGGRGFLMQDREDGEFGGWAGRGSHDVTS
jgi:hypothetical protein